MTEKPQYAKDEKGRFVTGNIGGGRPKSSRNKLGEAFIEALKDDFEEHGVAAIQVVRAEKPDQYLKVIASLLPKDVNLNLNDNSEMTDDELAERVRSLASTLAPFLTEGIGGIAEGAGSEASAQEPSRVH
ncbi:terminase small subunit [Pseudanabaena phage Pam1]|nr:terminase small subunit [Pseudanabaena phage Pam1]